MTPSARDPATEAATFHSFDGGFVEQSGFCRPDRHRDLDALLSPTA
jgi:hypothetical protein